MVYRGWTLTAYGQVSWPPFLPFVCIARLPTKSGTFEFNVEGATLELAIESMKRRVDRHYKTEGN